MLEDLTLSLPPLPCLPLALLRLLLHVSPVPGMAHCGGVECAVPGYQPHPENHGHVRWVGEGGQGCVRLGLGAAGLS